MLLFPGHNSFWNLKIFIGLELQVMLYYNEFLYSMARSPSLYFIYAYFISLIYDLKKCLYFFLQKSVLGLIFSIQRFVWLCSLMPAFIFTCPCLPLPLSWFSLSMYPQLLLFFDDWNTSWYDFAFHCNFDFMSYASICSLLRDSEHL